MSVITVVVVVVVDARADAAARTTIGARRRPRTGARRPTFVARLDDDDVHCARRCVYPLYMVRSQLVPSHP